MIIEATNLQKRFGPIVALKNVTVKIPEGLSLILGPNGGGKSTFMKLALGLYRPTGGEIRLLGGDPWKDAEIRKNVGAAFDPPALPRFVSGEEWLSFLAEAKGLEPKSEIAKVSKMFGMIPFIKRRVGDYSSGMLKRLSLAQAFLGEPKVVFLDEPLANLDFRSIGDIVSLISDWKEKGVNFIVISHVWEPLMELADYVVVISAGEVHLSGKVGDVMEEVRDLFKPPKFSHQGPS